MLAAWIALFGGVAALALAVTRRARARTAGAGRRPRGRRLRAARRRPRLRALAGADDHRPVRAHTGLVDYLRRDVPSRAVVFADLETSYRISAYVPVYVCNAPPAHVADTTANRPYARRKDLLRFLRTGSLAIPRSYHAGWLVLRRAHEPVARVEAQGARAVYRDASFIVFKL